MLVAFSAVLKVFNVLLSSEAERPIAPFNNTASTASPIAQAVIVFFIAKPASWSGARIERRTKKWASWSVSRFYHLFILFFKWVIWKGVTRSTFFIMT